MNKKIVSGFAIAAAATLALGAVATAPANAATKTVKLAFLGPLTGAYAGLGQDQIPGAIWAGISLHLLFEGLHHIAKFQSRIQGATPVQERGMKQHIRLIGRNLGTGD